MVHAVRYCFSQSFAIPDRKAYLWCTDFAPEDHTLMGEDNAKREVIRLTDTTVILKEVFQKGNIAFEKQKLVQFYPDRLSWVSTHLTGPNKYSQFIYEISAEGNNASRLNFTALHIEQKKENMTKTDVKLLANRLRKYDSKVWKLLAKAMKKELNTKPAKQKTRART